MNFFIKKKFIFFHPGNKLISVSLDCFLMVWEIPSGQELGRYQFSSQIFSLGMFAQKKKN